MNTYEGSAANVGIGRFWRSSHVNEDENGGSMRMTSNFEGFSEEREAKGYEYN